MLALDEAEDAGKEVDRACKEAELMRGGARSFNLATKIEIGALRDQVKAVRSQAIDPTADITALRAAFTSLEQRIPLFGETWRSLLTDVESRLAESVRGAKFTAVYVRDVHLDPLGRHIVVEFSDGSKKTHLLRRGGGGLAEARVLELIGANAGTGGGGDVLLTYTAPEQKTVGAAAANLTAAGAAGTLRRITVWVPNGSDTGIYCNPAGTATSAHFLIPPGGHGVWDTNQALSAIRAGSADVTAYVQVGTA